MRRTDEKQPERIVPTEPDASIPFKNLPPGNYFSFSFVLSFFIVSSSFTAPIGPWIDDHTLHLKTQYRWNHSVKTVR